MIVGLATVGVGRSVPSASATAGPDPRSAAIAVSASGWYGTDGIMPAQPRIEAASGYERGVRVKVPVLVGTVAAASLAAALARRTGLRRPQRSPQPLALRARSLPLRAPPVLPLG
jgi:hypothetical protein